MLFRKIN
jgi:hypothetical protein